MPVEMAVGARATVVGATATAAGATAAAAKSRCFHCLPTVRKSTQQRC